jgi:hypothetical protein
MYRGQKPHPGEYIDRTYVAVIRQSGFGSLHYAFF